MHTNHKSSNYFVVLSFLLLALLLFSLPSLIRIGLTKEDKMAMLHDEIRQRQPDFIFIGNSMLDSRIDTSYFDTLTNKKSYMIWHGGIMSSVWYLILKNVISDIDYKPRGIFFFFRDTHLTETRFRTGGEYRQYIDMYRIDDEHVLDDIIKEEKSLNDIYSDLITDAYPILNKSQDIRNKISGLIVRIINFFIRDSRHKFTISEVNNIFDLKYFRKSSTDGENINKTNHNWNYDFADALGKSFLPHMIDIAQKRDLMLVFVRVKTRPPLNGITNHDNPILGKYVEQLKEYLESNNCKFYDFTEDNRITLDMYGVGDHINEDNKKKHTKIFFDAVKDIL